MADNTFLAPLSPIQRSTPSDNLLSFQKNEYNIFNTSRFYNDLSQKDMQQKDIQQRDIQIDNIQQK
jgi:hypothetical protein